MRLGEVMIRIGYVKKLIDLEKKKTESQQVSRENVSLG
jgi:hypothetical protein